MRRNLNPSSSESNRTVSVEYLKNCAVSGDPCKGGQVEDALQLVLREQAVYSESKFFEKISDSSIDCNRTGIDIKLNLNNIISLPQGDEDNIKTNLLNYGPIAVSFYAPKSFRSYKRGIFHAKERANKKPNHSALLIGYGNDSKRGKYWILVSRVTTSIVCFHHWASTDLLQYSRNRKIHGAKVGE